MKKVGWIGGLLWVGALVVSFQSGRSQADVEVADEVVIVPEKRVMRRAAVRSRGEVVADFEALLPERGNVLQHDELWLLADEWAAREPEAAVAWLSELKFEDVRNPYLFAALSRWAGQDAKKAAAWLLVNRPEADESLHYLKAGLVRGMARRDPDAALAVLLAEPNIFGRSTIDFVLGAWAQGGGGQLLNGIMGLPADRVDLRMRAFQKAADHLAPEMMAEAREFSLRLANPAEALALQSALADRWSRRSPAEALAWAEEVSSPAVIGVVAKNWARQKPLEAAAWLETRRGAPEYDLSARSVAWSVVGIDPQVAFGQVAGMKSESLREETFEQLGRFWISDQPQRARAFLEGENPLPANLREALLSHFE